MKFYIEPQGIEWVKKVVLWIRPLLGVQSSVFLAAPLTPPFHVNMFTDFFSRLFPRTQDNWYHPVLSLSRWTPDSNSGSYTVKAAGPWLEVGSDDFQLGQKMGTEHTDVQTWDQQSCVLRDRHHSSIQDWSITPAEPGVGGWGEALLYGGEWQGAKRRARFCIWIVSATVCDLEQVTPVLCIHRFWSGAPWANVPEIPRDDCT